MRVLAGSAAAIAAMLATALVSGIDVRWKRPPAPGRSRRSGGAAWAAAAGGLLIGHLVVGSVAASLATAALAAAVVRNRRLRATEAAAVEIRRSWPDAIRMVAGTMRSGASVRNALVDLATAGPAPLRNALSQFVAREQILGVGGALRALGDELADPVADRVIEVLVLAHDRGGTLVPALLDEVAASLAEDLAAEDEIATQALEQRLNARIVTVAPWAVLVLLVLRDGPYRSFYASSAGALVVGVGGTLTLLGGLAVARLGRRSPEPRVLAAGR